MKYLKYVLAGLAVAATVGTVYKLWKKKGPGDSGDIDDEEKNHPELRYGVYENPVDGPSWRVEPGEYYNPA
ncbi:hypothetical protein P5673_013007 [Acropora cervicornis]|uniref:Uncharacterized protein n=1 Tax=Acropora cervicornis TaxID=6130 RepID=A0AAD9V6Y9_ACRCE|nr:hypothetical protein P5673_013007 [Acropora cervicornis]